MKTSIKQISLDEIYSILSGEILDIDTRLKNDINSGNFPIEALECYKQNNSIRVREVEMIAAKIKEYVKIKEKEREIPSTEIIIFNIARAEYFSGTANMTSEKRSEAVSFTDIEEAKEIASLCGQQFKIIPK